MVRGLLEALSRGEKKRQISGHPNQKCFTNSPPPFFTRGRLVSNGMRATVVAVVPQGQIFFLFQQHHRRPPLMATAAHQPYRASALTGWWVRSCPAASTGSFSCVIHWPPLLELVLVRGEQNGVLAIVQGPASSSNFFDSPFGSEPGSHFVSHTALLIIHSQMN
jgi:hypothetical protein